MCHLDTWCQQTRHQTLNMTRWRKSLNSFWMNLLFRLRTCGLHQDNNMYLSDHCINVTTSHYLRLIQCLKYNHFWFICFHYVISACYLVSPSITGQQNTVLSTFQTHSHMGPSFHTAYFDPFPPRFATTLKHKPTHSLTHKHIQGHRVQSHPLPAIKATFVLTVASGLPGAWKRGSGRLYPYTLFFCSISFP